MDNTLSIGSRVSTVSGNGIVRFIGTTAFATGKWVGVELDVPSGKNNGAVQGKSYFTCRDNCGVFVRPTAIKLLPSRKSVEEPIRPNVFISL
jgi:dynactin 1